MLVTSICYANADKQEKPNVVYIMADDLGYGELGCFGQKIIETPNIDKLAREGMIFTNHYAGSNVCAPSRCALMTGKHTGQCWIRDNKPLPFEGNQPIPEREITVAEIFKKAGYTTGAFGKWGLGYPGSEGSPNNQGFDLFFGYNCQRHAHSYYPTYLRYNDDSLTLQGNLSKPYTDYSADIIHSKALQFIEDNKDKPFFLYYPTTIPHGVYHQPDDEFIKYYTEKTGFPKGDASSKDFSAIKEAAMTARLDKHVGEVMAKLKELNLLDNTLVIFTSDNGTALNKERNKYLQTGGQLHGKKGEMYEGGIKVPMIASWKGKIKPNSTSDHISAFWDLLPTCAEIANVKAPENINGLSFLPSLFGNDTEQKKHRYLYWERNRSQGIRKGDMKAVINYDTDNQPLIEIYNLAVDPYEKKNIVDEQAELKAEFLSLIKSARKSSELYPFPKENKRKNSQAIISISFVFTLFNTPYTAP